jgi:hypothetical protein
VSGLGPGFGLPLPGGHSHNNKSTMGTSLGSPVVCRMGSRPGSLALLQQLGLHCLNWQTEFCHL